MAETSSPDIELPKRRYHRLKSQNSRSSSGTSRSATPIPTSAPAPQLRQPQVRHGQEDEYNDVSNTDEDAFESNSLASHNESHGSSTLNEEYQRDIRLQTAEMSQILSGIRKGLINGLNVEFNTKTTAKMANDGIQAQHKVHRPDTVVEAFTAADQQQHSHDSQTPGKTRKISQSTLVRAERVKFTIGLYYVNLKRRIDAERLHPETHKPLYPGVEGVYNPLQIIRNRKLYKKYKAHPPTLNYKIITPASQAFSNNKDKHLVWQVTLQEMVHDFTFRAQHFHELRDPRGELWFPPNQTQNDDDRRKLHERMFDYPTITVEDEEGRGARSSSRTRSTSKHKRFSRSPAKLFRSSHGSRSWLDIQKSDGYDTTQRKGSSSMSSDSSSSNQANNGANPMLLSPVKNVNIKSFRGHNGGEYTAESGVSEIENDNEEENDRCEGEYKLNNAGGMANYNELEDDKVQLSKQFNSLKKISSLLILGEHQLLNKPTILNNKYTEFQEFREKQSTELHDNFDAFNIDIAAFEKRIDGINLVTTSYRDNLSNNFANKVDVLLALCDRTIGELNTSLTLETRRLSERLEKLDSNLYSSMTGDNKNDMMVNFTYYVLENAIGFLLLIIWGLYKIFRFFKALWSYFFKIVVWVFG